MNTTGEAIGPMTRDERESWMSMALEEADAAARGGDVPVGAVIVAPSGDVVARGHNRREQDADPTAHAEIVAIRAAARERGEWRLDGHTLVVTLEPCPMCAGAIVNARIRRVLWGCPDEKGGAMGSLFVIGRDPRLHHRVEVVGRVRAEACALRLRNFFAARR
jgi:tRNA(adenine34) deaminase